MFLETLKQITSNEQEWKKFLSFSGQLFKYNFYDTILIYNQRPDATIVADMDTWNGKVGRWVNRGSKAIKVLDSDSKSIRYLFDINDTHGADTQRISSYRIKSEASQIYVMNYLGTDDTMDFDSFVQNICTEFIEKHDFADGNADQFICDSVIYSVFSRLELDTEEGYQFEHYLSRIDNIHVPEYATIISGIIGQVLRLIEKPARIYEKKERENNENRIYRRDWISGVPRDTRGDRGGEAETDRNRENGAGTANFTDGVPEGIRWDALPEDSTGRESEIRQNANRDIRNGGSEVSHRELSDESSGIENSSDLVQHNTLYKQPGIRNDGQDTNTAETATSSTTNRQLNGTSEVQHRDQRHSSGDSNERDRENPKIIEINQESSQNGGSNFLPQNQPTLIDLIEEKEPVHSINKLNYKFSPSDEIGAGGQKAKYKANIEAIKLLKVVEKENRLARADEQSILAKYVGWGGLSQAFNEEAKGWENEFSELKDLLTEDEYRSARASTPNAHYTDPIVIQAIYKALNNFGFKGGNILEPAMGTGLFYSLIPEAVSSKSKLYGVELDSISGRISKQLFQKANIKIQGFETTDYSDNFFDVAIGNVPFGDYKLHDSRYNKLNLNIHDYFFAKTLDKVRPGGVIAFITSKGTLDKASATFRKYLGERADLIGAIRLPNNAFKQIANTDVTTDIIFLQKKERIAVMGEEPNWIGLGYTEDSVPVNQYYLDNPNMLLGKMIFDNRMFGSDGKYTSLVADEGFDLTTELDRAVEKLDARINDIVTEKEKDEAEYISADPLVKNFTFTVIDQNIYFRENSVMLKVSLPEKGCERIKGMCEIRIVLRQVIDIQTNGCTASELKPYQIKLLDLYNSFTQKHGIINSKLNLRAFQEDSDLPLLSSLEGLDEKGNVKALADIFYKQTIRPYEPITSVNTAVDALAASLSERGVIDIEYMLSIYSADQDKIIEDLKGIMFQNPENKKWETADEYLSGDVRHKLMAAQIHAENDNNYLLNVTALESVQPEDLDASDIDVRLGTTWIETEDIDKFVYETLKVPAFYRKDDDRYRSKKSELYTTYNSFTSSWSIQNKALQWSSMKATLEFGTRRMDAFSIIEDSLNLRSVVVKDRVEDLDGKVRYEVNKNETIAARAKQDQIKEEFKDWIFKDPDRRKKYVDFYNANFNNLRLREYNGSHLKFPGMSPEIMLRDHQSNAVARILYGGNALISHVVGSGKTIIMQAASMEMRRLNLIRKAMFVLPNHLTEQQGGDFIKLYPAANILVATERDFEKVNRKRFLAKIATGDYDAIIIGQSQFERIPMSSEYQQNKIRNKINEIVDYVTMVKHENDDKWTVKQMEKMKFNLEAELLRLADAPKDDVVTFEELGVDCLFVDEAHFYKNGGVFTKMRNVAGISGSSAKKVLDMQMKCEYVNSLNEGRGVIFATGTPISNSMTEMFIMQQFLQKPELIAKRVQHFDAWAANFGEVVSSLELAPEGRGFRMRNRFSKFTNLPVIQLIG